MGHNDRPTSQFNQCICCAFVLSALLMLCSAAGGDESNCGYAWTIDGLPPGGLSGIVNDLVNLPDSDGTSRLVIGGLFTQGGGVSALRILIGDGETWSQMGDGFNDVVRALAVCEGADGPVLYAGGLFTASGDQPLNYIARWDGENWLPLGDGVNNNVQSLYCCSDGNGQYTLYVGGQFTAGDNISARITVWDGENWHPLDTGLTGGSNPSVEAIVKGAVGVNGEPRVYAGGLFTIPGDSSPSRIAQWDGTTWSQVGGPAGNVVRALTIWEQNGIPVLVAGGGFDKIGGTDADRIALWDGVQWHPMDAGFSTAVRALAVHDDGTGERLYAGGNFSHSGAGGFLGRIARWHGEQWEHMSFGVNNDVNALLSINNQFGPGLIAGGVFTATGVGPNLPRIIRWQREGLPQFVQHPESVEASTGQTITLEAAVDDEATYQWLRNGEAVDDTKDGRITGATSPQLTINSVIAEDAGAYVLTATNACGSAPSYSAQLTVEIDDSAPSPDLNNDGVVDVFDLILLINMWGPCPAPGEGDCPADLNSDGVVDVFDLILLINAWGPV